MKSIITFFFSVFLVIVLSAQEKGGPYLPDENTALLMHFDGNASNSASVGYNGIAHGSGVSYDTDGVHGQCLRLDNSTWDKQSWIEVPYYEELNSTEEFSVECWFKINSWGENTSGTRTLFKKETNNGARQFEAILNPKDGSGQVDVDCIDNEDGQWGADAGIADILQLNKWYHIVLYYKHDYKHVYCLVRDENYKELFAASGYSETAAVIGEGKFMLGFGGWDASALDCSIDELRISNIYRKYRDDVLKDIDVSAFKDSVFLPLKDKWTVYQWPLGEYYPINNETGEIFRENSCGPTMLTRTIHYWEYPRFPEGIIQHNMENCNWYANYDTTEYLWDRMLEVFMPGTTEEIYAPSALFSAQVGVASKKSFDNMYAMPKFLKENFLFSDKTRVLFEDEYTPEEFENIIKNELNNGRPVMVGGVAERTAYGGSGHYYIINGYNSKNEFFTDYSFNDNFWHKLADFDYGISQDIMVYMEPDWGDKVLALEQPKSGDLYQKGSNLDIQWSSENISNLIVEYSSDAGYNWHTVADNVDANLGSYSWTIPDTISDDYRIRISDMDNLNVYRKSSGIEVYANKEFAFEYPQQDSKFLKGTEQTIYWQSDGIKTVKLEYSTDNTNWYVLSDSVNVPLGNLSVQLPDIITENILLKATELNESGNVYTSESFQLVENPLWGGPYESDNQTKLLMHFENDISNNANTLLLPNETTPIGFYEDHYESNLGKAFRVVNGDVMGDAILVKNSEDLDLGNDWTMEAWVNVSNIMGERTVASLIINKWEAFNIGAGWQHFGASVSFENGTEVGFGNPEEYQLDKWYHVALISDASSEKIYFYVHDENLNPIYKEAKSFPEGSNGLIKSNDYLLTLGGLGGGSNFELDGFLDEIRIVKRSELSKYIQSELAELPFSDDFSNNYVNWTAVSVTGDDQWHLSGDDGIDGGKCARFYNYSSVESNDDWLVSPVFNTEGIGAVGVSFKYTYNVDGVAPDFYYASTFDGDPANSDWTQIDKDFWTSGWDWQDANIEIENPGESFVFAVRYEVASGSAFWFLMDNVTIEGYETVDYEKVGETKHFEFYAATTDGTQHWNQISSQVEDWYAELCSYWDRPGRDSIYETDVPIKIYLTTQQGIDDAIGINFPDWKYGGYKTPNELYVAVPPENDPVYNGSFTTVCKNVLSQLMLKKRLVVDGDSYLPSYFSEAFGQYYCGYRPNKEAILQAISDYGGYPSLADIKSTDGFDTTYRKDLLVSYVEAQALSRVGIQRIAYDGYETLYQRHFKYFYELDDDNCIQLRDQTEHFDLYFTEQDRPYMSQIASKLEEKYAHYTGVFELDIKHKFSVVIYPSEEAGMYNQVYSDNYNGGSGWSGDLLDFLSPAAFSGGIDEALRSLIPHEFFHAFHFNFVTHLFDIAPFNSEGMAELMAYEGENQEYLDNYGWYFEQGFNRFEKENGREPKLADIMPDSDGYMSVYTYGQAFWYFMIQNYTDYPTIRKFFEKGEDWNVFDISYNEMDAAYIAYLKSFFEEVTTKPEVATLQASEITIEEATLNGEVTSDGGASITQRGFCWSASNSNPRSSDQVITVAGTTGAFSYNLDGLSSSATYYYRAFASNSEGTSIGDVMQFTTQVQANLPVCETNEASELTTTSAELNGTVSSDGGTSITQRGFYWSEIHNLPNLSDHVETVSGTTGEISFELLGLTPSTTYYYRTFATNNIGVTLGNVLSFTTAENIEVMALPFVDDFEQDITTDDATFDLWTTENIEGWNFWHIIPWGGIDGGQCMRFENTDVNQNDWLITRPIDCSSVTSVKVNFNVLYKGTGIKPKLYYSSEYGGDASKTSWNELDYSLGPNENEWYSIEDIIVENSIGPMWFAFHYQSEPQNAIYFLIDNFKVEPKSTGVNNISASTIYLYPNPVTDASRIMLNLDKTGEVCIKIYNVTGEEQLIIPDRFSSTGNYNIPIGDYFKKSGIYFVQILTPVRNKIVKVVVN